MLFHLSGARQDPLTASIVPQPAVCNPKIGFSQAHGRKRRAEASRKKPVLGPQYVDTIDQLDLSPELRHLDLSHNGISEIGGLDRLVKLEVLKIAFPVPYEEPDGMMVRPVRRTGRIMIRYGIPMVPSPPGTWKLFYAPFSSTGSRSKGFSPK